MLDAYPNVDGVVSFTHGTGCGMASSGEGYEVVRRQPKYPAVLLVGLGCEVFGRMKSVYGIDDESPFLEKEGPG